MASHVGAQGDENDQGHAVAVRHDPQVFNAHHDVVFLKCGGVFRDQIVVPEVALGLLQFDHHQAALRGCPGEGVVRQRSPGGDPRDKGAVAVGIPGGNQGQRIVGGQGFVDLFFGEFSAVGRSAHAKIVRHAGGEFIRVHRQGLIPDSQYSGGAVGFAEQAVGVVDAGIQKADHGARALVCQGRRVEGGENAGGVHAGGVQGGEQIGNAVVSILLQRKGKDAV